MTPTSKQPDLPVRLMPFDRRYLEQVLRVERASFPKPWGKAQFANAVRTRDVSMLVALVHNEVVGFVVLNVCQRHVEIWNMAVVPESRRRGVGQQLVSLAKARLGGQRERVRVDVGESNVAAQLFFRSLGFHAYGVDACPHIAEPAIAFEFNNNLAAVDGLAVLRSVMEGDGRVVHT